MSSSHFSTANIPFGIASSIQHPRAAAVTRIADGVIFLDVLHDAGLFRDIAGLTGHVFQQATLNEFAALGRPISRSVRKILQERFTPGSAYDPSPGAVEPFTQVTMQLPMHIGDFTDFSWSKDHVVTAGEAIFGERKMPPGFFHFPLGYGGHSSSIVLSGTPVARPLGQFRSNKGSGDVEFGPCEELDYELELACIVGKPLPKGDIVPASKAGEHIFGVMLLNDWSARDFIRLEIIPLGPLNGKNFMTSISPWIVTLDALEPFTVPLCPREVPVAPYLDDPSQNGHYDITLKAELSTSTGTTPLCKVNTKDFYWSFGHILAHQAIGGCGLYTGDAVGTGTCSSADRDTMGCLIEQTMGGKDPITLHDGSSRGFLADGDTIRISAFAGTEDKGVGFGECIGQVKPALVYEKLT